MALHWRVSCESMPCQMVTATQITYVFRNLADKFGVADVVLAPRNGPLEWPEVTVEDLDVLLPVTGYGVLLGQSDAAIFEWGEYRRRHLLVVHL